MKSIMQHQFSRTANVNVQRSKFNRSHGHKTAFDAGKLIPIYVDEALPGDTFNLNMTGFARMATPIFPIMDNAYMDTHFFAVPYRLVWDNWERFNGAQDNPGDSTDFIIPARTTPVTPQVGSDADYLGLPVGKPLNGFSVLPFRAIALIWNEWFRDQNLQDSLQVATNDSEVIITSGWPWANTGGMLPRNKRHDYFTSCLPWPQKGDSVMLPLGTSSPITTDSINNYATVKYSVDGNAKRLIADSVDGYRVDISNENQGTDPTLYADLTNATAATINQIREAFQIQRLLEKDARGGTRYNELIKAHFGVTVPDFRVQRPEYLGGGSSAIQVTPVPQTSSTDATTPQGNVSGYGTTAFHNHGFVKSFTEHCIIIGFVSVRADLTYQQGINRMWTRSTRFDFYQPTLANLGEQAVLNKEIYYNNDAADDEVFGYQERYAEYRYHPSKITGLMRSTAAGSLDAWHLSQEFASRPGLNSDFIKENPPFDRVIAVPSEPHFIFDSYFDLKCSRPMPLYATPGFIDHF